jgi:hypothetical protein
MLTGRFGRGSRRLTGPASSRLPTVAGRAFRSAEPSLASLARTPFAVRGAPDGRASLSPFAFPRASRWSALAVAARPWRSRFARPPAPRSLRGAPCLAVPTARLNRGLPPVGLAGRASLLLAALLASLRCLQRLYRRAVDPFGIPGRGRVCQPPSLIRTVSANVTQLISSIRSVSRHRSSSSNV